MNTPNNNAVSEVEASEIAKQLTRKTKVVIGEFGNGRHSPAMREVYSACINYFNMSELKAHTVARQMGCDAGQLNNQKVGVKVGAAKGKDMKMSLSEVDAKCKVNATWSLQITHLCQALYALTKHGLFVGDGNDITPELMKEVTDASKTLEPVSQEAFDKEQALIRLANMKAAIQRNQEELDKASKS